MQIKINGQEIRGKTQDVAELLKILSNERRSKKIPVTNAPQPAPAQNQMSLDDTIRQSQELRQKLQEDPNYNPHGGVVASKDTHTPADIVKANTERVYAADLEPGVSGDNY